MTRNLILNNSKKMNRAYNQGIKSKISSILLGLLFITYFGCPARAQDSLNEQRLNMENQEFNFNFWLGKWDATWDEGDGKMGSGTNEITKILDGTVLKEDFQITEGKNKGFKGTSISVYQPKFKRWKQAWADSQGGYFDFEGEFKGEKRIFKTEPIVRNGKQVVQRMVFKDIQKDSFIWDWEMSMDGGETWNLNWRINYKRMSP